MSSTAIAALQHQAFSFARRLLKSNGYFLCKLFQGHEAFQDLRSLLESLFGAVHVIKPSSSRSESSELYLLALKYRSDATNRPTNASDDNQNENTRIETNRHEIERLINEARRVRTKNKDKS